jgi:hypothetical protein
MPLRQLGELLRFDAGSPRKYVATAPQVASAGQ